MKKHFSSFVSAAACGLGVVTAFSTTAFAVTPILEFTFNETGTTAASTGSAVGSGVLWDSAYNPTDLHSAGGTGVSGAPGDRAFDNSSSTGMGSLGVGGLVNAGDNNAVDGLTSFTLQGWFNTGTAINGVARLFDKNNGSGVSGFQLRGTTVAGQLALIINNQGVTSSAAYGATNTWVFFAVTFDGTLGSNNVSFYIGSTSSSVSLVNTTTINATQSIANSVVMTMGNSSWLSSGSPVNNRPFDGLLDNMRVYGTTSGSGGALSLGELEAVRLADATPVPEPASAAALAGVLGLGFSVFSRRRRSARG